MLRGKHRLKRVSVYLAMVTVNVFHFFPEARSKWNLFRCYAEANVPGPGSEAKSISMTVELYGIFLAFLFCFSYSW